MLDDIRLHVDQDEQVQIASEEAISDRMLETYKASIKAIEINIPSLLPLLSDKLQRNYSVFVNKNGEFNIVDISNGKTFYGLQPSAEIATQLELICNSSYQIKCRKEALDDFQSIENEVLQALDSELLKKKYGSYALPDEPSCVVVLGLGIGSHIKDLIESYNIRHLIIYEPQIQYLNCSAMAVSWADMLACANEKNTAIYLQMGKDGRDLLSDINQLANFDQGVDSFHLYKHYNHPVFDSIERELLTNSWESLEQKGITFKLESNYISFSPNWTKSCAIGQFEIPNEQLPLYTKNMDAFAKYFPEIHKSFKGFKPKCWQVLINASGEVNYINLNNGAFWSGAEVIAEAEINTSGFIRHPNRDGLILGYDGNKLKDYLHYRFVKKTGEILEDIENEEGALPETLKSIIVFGVSNGYDIESLFAKHTVEKIFICEPNRDFFYGSLFAIDWAELFERLDQEQGRIYLNIGDDGSHLMRDLLNQFYSIGPYILADTYFFQVYYNSALNKAIGQLREQLKLVISMGEYYDHARYGLVHTNEGCRIGLPVLKENPQQYLKEEDRQVPVFVVANGPSLDNAIEIIKEHRDEAIVISCGTTLQALHRNNIKPDFHAEIEQNRSTYDWNCRIGDFAYLKSIPLVSCNGIHPDTCTLFKDVFIAFKDGESSTAVFESVVGKGKYQTIEHAFPTVGNFVVDLVTTWGFKQIYLMGMDLGFIDNKYHHSKSSGYYINQSKEIYDYGGEQNTSIPVEGNFANIVFTKHEFKISKAIMEDVFRSKKVECYNCSNGVRIQGTLPLHLENVLILTDKQQRDAAIEKLKSSCYEIIDANQYGEKYDSKYDVSALESEFDQILNLLDEPFEQPENAEKFVESQRELLIQSYKRGNSLLFYLLYGTFNYVNALFSKVMLTSSTENKSRFLERVRIEWQDALNTIKFDFLKFTNTFDFCSTGSTNRRLALSRAKSEAKTIHFFTQEDFQFYQLQAVGDDTLNYSPQRYQFHYFFEPEKLIEENAFCIGTPYNYLFERYLVRRFPNDYKVEWFFNHAVSTPDGIVINAGTLSLDSIISIVNQSLSPALAKSIPIIVALTRLPSKQLLNRFKSVSPGGIIYFFCDTVGTGNKHDVLDGKLPYRQQGMDYLVADHLFTHKQTLLIIERFKFVDGGAKEKNAYLQKIADELDYVHEFIEYPDYLLVANNGEKIDNLVTDMSGSRGRPIHAKINNLVLQGTNIQKSIAMRDTKEIETFLQAPKIK